LQTRYALASLVISSVITSAALVLIFLRGSAAAENRERVGQPVLDE
jgi:hypothetical protein